MKKLFLLLGVAAFCFAATSCKKSCVCEGTYKGEVEGIDPIEYTLPPTTVGEMSKADCESFKWGIPVELPGYTYTYDITCKAE